MEKVAEMIEMLECELHDQLENGIEKVDTDEFGKVTDILKDMAMAQYYLKVVHAMNEKTADITADNIINEIRNM